MKGTVEHTPGRLVVRLGAFFPHGATCVFDKTTGRARFERRLFFVPRKTIDVALADVVAFEVVEVVEVVEVLPPLNSCDPRVVLASGKRFYLSPANTREETREVARQVRAFLGLSQQIGS